MGDFPGGGEDELGDLGGLAEHDLVDGVGGLVVVGVHASEVEDHRDAVFGEVVVVAAVVEAVGVAWGVVFVIELDVGKKNKQARDTRETFDLSLLK